MDKKELRIIVIALLVVSVVIYALQIVIFHDERNTAFYIFQDMAFMPVTIAVATLVVGELLGSKEKKERLEKTKMLTSSFFTQLGVYLIRAIADVAEMSPEIQEIVDFGGPEEKSEAELQKVISDAKIKVHLDDKSYETVRKLLGEQQQTMLTLATSSMIHEHENFTEMLWGLFHVQDEFRLRGAYSDLSEQDISHMNTDFEEIFKLMLMNWIGNVRYLRKTYPGFYKVASTKIKEHKNQEV